MIVRLILGLLITVAVLAVAGRRAKFLYDLIRSGQPVDRFDRLGARLWAQVKEVFGQRKLLKWSIPGAAHFFTFWGFVILGSVYVEAYGSLFTFPDEFAIPIIGHWDLLGFAQDFIAVMCLLGLATFAAIRLKNSPRKLGRRSRFEGSHLGGAWVAELGEDGQGRAPGVARGVAVALVQGRGDPHRSSRRVSSRGRRPGAPAG